MPVCGLSRLLTCLSSPAPACPCPSPACPQTYVDPDEIFQQHQKTCSLDEVFANGEAGRQLPALWLAGGEPASAMADGGCVQAGSGVPPQPRLWHCMARL